MHRQRLISIAIVLVGLGSVIALMVLSGLHVQDMVLKWVLRAIAAACLIGIEALVLLYWAHHPAGSVTPPRRRRSPTNAETGHYPE
jgi:hypothetical protein